MLEAQGDCIDLILTDLLMPEVGPDQGCAPVGTALRLRAVAPKLERSSTYSQGVWLLR